MTQNQTQQDKDPFKKAEIKTMQADLLVAQRMSGKKDFNAIKESEKKIIQKKEIEEKPKPPIKKPEPQKPVEQKATNKGEEAIRRFESEKAQEEARVRADVAQRESEAKRKQDAIAQGKFEEERRKRLAEQIKLEETRNKQQEEFKNRRLKEIRQREEAMLTEREAKRTRERERMQLEEEKLLLQKELDSLSGKRAPLEAEVNQLSKRESQLQESLDEVLRKENEAEKEVGSIEAREKTANTGEEKKILEQERWEAEERRRKVEKERWEWEAEVGKIKDQKREINLRYNKLLNRGEEIAERRRAISDRQEEIQIENEKNELERELQQLKEKQKPLEQEINRLLDKESQLQESLDEVLRKENEAEKEVGSIEAREKTANTGEEKKILEQERWEAEERRRKVEKERWEWEAEVGRIKGEVKRVEREYQNVLSKEREIMAKLYPTKINKDIEKEISTQPNPQKPRTENTSENQVKPKINPRNFGREPIQNKTIQQIEEIKQPLSQSQKEESIPIGKSAVKDIQDRQMEVLKEIERLRSEAETQRPRPGSNTEQPQQITESVPITENSRPDETIELERNTTPTTQPTPQKQKFWMREDLQPFNSGSIRENPQIIDRGLAKENVIKNKLDELQKEEESEREKFLERIQEGKFKKESSEYSSQTEALRQDLISPEILKAVPRKPSGFSKLWSRFLVTIMVLIVFGIVFGSIYYFFFVRKAQIPLTWCEREKIQIPQPEWTEERCVPPPVVIPEIIIPPDLINIEARRKEIVVPQQGDPLKELSRFLEEHNEEFEQGKLTRIVIKSLDKKEVLGFQDFLSLFAVKISDNLSSKINKDFNLFIYPQKEGRRWGIVSRVEIQEGVDVTQELTTALRLWEDTAEKDLDPLFVFFGKTAPAINDFFTRVSYNGTVIRCQTFSKEDFGSCYAIKNDIFVLTTSLESIKNILNGIK